MIENDIYQIQVALDDQLNILQELIENENPQSPRTPSEAEQIGRLVKLNNRAHSEACRIRRQLRQSNG